jgi:dTDP-glucose 4,6-dehydratase/UDP-glucose 4-epimerase
MLCLYSTQEMKVLIIGSEGFIGSHCVRYFKQVGFEVIACDLLDIKNTAYLYFKIDRFHPNFDTIIKSTLPSVIINAAGSGSVPLSFSNPQSDFMANTVDVFMLLESIRLYSPDSKYINISSAAVYGNPEVLPIKEHFDLAPLSPYGWHKMYAEKICMEYAQLYGIKTISVRPFSVFGPGLRKQLFWDLYLKSKDNQHITLFGTGNETRDFIYIDDLVEVIALLIQKSAFDGAIYNLANGIEYTISEVSNLFFKFYKPNTTITFNGQVKPGDPRYWKADIEKITKLGYKSNINLPKGLQNYAEWLQQQE